MSWGSQRELWGVVEGPPNIWPTRRGIADVAGRSGERSDRWQMMELEDNVIDGQRDVV